MPASRSIQTLIASLVLSLAGCASTGASSTDDALGMLAIPLESEVNGVHYRLSSDRFVLSGPVTSTLQHNGSGASVYAVVPPGSYSVELLDGWALERQGDTGYEAVAAELVSPNPRAIEINSGSTTIASWVFQTGGEALNLAPGTFQGNLAVIDSDNPADTLFGDLAVSSQAHVDALEGITRIAGSLSVGGGVQTLEPLSVLSRIDGDLIISDTDDLPALDGLGQLSEISGKLIISGNAALSTLRGLSALAAVDALSISGNAALTSCEAEWLANSIAAAGADPDPIEISNDPSAPSCP